MNKPENDYIVEATP